MHPKLKPSHQRNKRFFLLNDIKSEGTKKEVTVFRGSQYLLIIQRMQVKRALLFWTMGNKTNLKAVSLLIALKSKLDKTSSLNKASQNKIAELAGVSPNTIKRYMPVWERLGLVEWRGKNKDVFVINRLSSKTKHRNIDLSRVDMKSFKSIYESLKSFIFLIVLSCKCFVKRMIRIATDPKKGEDYKGAKKFCNRYARREQERVIEYKEYGISYKKIGEKLGFCKRMAEKIVEKAVKKGWCHKETHFEKVSMPGVNRMYVEGFTFTTKNYGFIVKANTYKLNRNIGMALIGGNF